MKEALNRIYNLECIEGMERLYKKYGKCIDLIITSPPYNLGGKFHTGNVIMKSYDMFSDNLPEEEYQEQQIKFLNTAYSLLKDGGSMFYNHKPRIKKGKTIHPLEWVSKSNFILKQEIIWRTGSQNFDKIRFYPMTERVYWLVKDTKTKLFNEVGLSDIWEFKNTKRHSEHKATFPIELPHTIIKCFNDAEIVLDPYMGIGTTAVACKLENRSFIGFELSERYIEIANERLIGI